MRFLVATLTLVVGVAAFVHGGADDSPGLQLIGAVLVAVSIASVIRGVRRSHVG